MSRRYLDRAQALRTGVAVALLSPLALALSTSAAHAQRHQSILSIGFGGGAVVPVGDAKSDFKSGVTGQGFLLVHLGPLPALRFNLAFQKLD
jgi:hypothetical protein